MSRPELATNVHVADEHGGMHVFGPDDPPPGWAVGKIVNPKAWVGGKVPGPAESPADERTRLLARIAELEAAMEPPGPDHGDGPPPKGGAGSGAPAWREYAAKNNVEVPADASREDVIAALEAANVRTE